MEIAEDLTPLELLGVAIRSEIEAADLYHHMAARVVNLDLRERLTFLQREEEKHRRLLEAAYDRQFSGVERVLPARSLVPTVLQALQEEMSIPELFRLAIEAERTAAAFYGEMAGRVEEETSRTLLRYLSQMEHGHEVLLQSEYELIQRFPSSYQVEHFHLGEEMIHFGP
ncbi:MAG: ferritin family protein [Chloroflexia bacterium]